MQKKEKDKKSLLGELRYRYHILLMKEMGLVFLQMVGMGCCTLYVLCNFYGWEIGDFTINTTYYTFIFRGDYLSPLCLVLSVLLVIPRPADLIYKINILRSAIKCLTRKKNISDSEENTIRVAKTFITDIDRAHQKKKEGRDNEIKPHEKRMVLRKRMIIFGIPGLVILTFILIGLLGFTFPQIIAVDMVLGYTMVLYESFYYQTQLKEAHVSVMTKYHKEIICPEMIQEQQYEFYKKIYFMEADRYSNYCLVLGVVSSILNLLAILLSLLDASDNYDLKRLFAIDSISVNTEISVIFMGASIAIFLFDLLLNFLLGPQIVELEAKQGMGYSTKNYKAIKEDWDRKINGTDTMVHNIFGEQVGEFLFKPFSPANSTFSRSALDVSRGRYDYNNDVLVEAKNKIPVDCMSTLEDAFPGRVPRFKLTAFVVWVFLFCFLVWGNADIDYLIPISIVSLIFYDIIIMFFAFRTWNEQWEWIVFEKEMEKLVGINIVREVKWDFLSYLLGNSIILVVLSGLYSLWNENQITYEISIAYIVFFTLISIIGYRYAKKRRILHIPFVFTKLGGPILMGVGIICSLLEKNIDIFKVLIFVIIVPAIIEMFNSYLGKIEKSIKKSFISIPFCVLFLMVNWLSIFIWLYYYKGLKGNCVNMLIKWFYIIFAILLICSMVWELREVCEKKIL